MLLDIIKLSLKRIKNRILESIVVIISLGFGLAIVSTVVGNIISFKKDIENHKNSVWNRKIQLSPSTQYQDYNDKNVLIKLGSVEMGDPIQFTKKEMSKIKELCPSVDYVFLHTWYSLDDDNSEGVDWWETGKSIGCENGYFDYAKMEIESGSLFTQDDIDNANNVIILGGNLKKVLFKDKNVIGKQIIFNDVEYTIIGVLKEDFHKNLSEAQLEEFRNQPMDKNNLYYIPITNVPWVNGTASFDTFNLGVDDFYDLENAVSEVKLYIESEYPNGEVSISSGLDSADKTSEAMVNNLTVLVFIAFIALLISALTNLNLMLARIIREKKGLGISIALGSSKKTLFTSLVTESSIIGVIGAVIGLIFTFLLGNVLNKIMGNGASMASSGFSIVNISIYLGITVLVTVIFSVIPALEATKVSPSQVLRED